MIRYSSIAYWYRTVATHNMYCYNTLLYIPSKCYMLMLCRFILKIGEKKRYTIFAYFLNLWMNLQHDLAVHFTITCEAIACSDVLSNGLRSAHIYIHRKGVLRFPTGGWLKLWK